jgi:hypothetical protein
MKQISSINIKLAMAFGIIIVIAVGAIGSSSVVAQTNTSSGATGGNTTGGTTTGNATTNGNQSGVTTASEIESLAGNNTGEVASPNTGLMQGLEKEQTSETGGNLTAADKTAGQNATNTTTGGGGGTNATTSNQSSSQNNTGNPLSNVPIIGELFK